MLKEKAAFAECVKRVSIENAAIPEYSFGDIRRHFTAITLRRAQGIVKNGGVLHVGWDDEEQMVVGAVQGTADDPYLATIEFEDGGLSADCSCPVCYDCKHAAACLLELAQSNSTQAMTPPDTLEEPQLSDVDGWAQLLTTHQKKLQRQLEVSFRSSYDCVIFSLEPSFGNSAGAVRIAIRIYSVRISDSGGFSKGRLYKIDNYGHYHGTGSTREDNLLIDTVRAMTRHSVGESRYQIAEPYLIEGHLGAAVMQLLMNTAGRVFLDNNRQAPMVSGEAKVLQMAWEPIEASSSLHLELSIGGTDHWYPVFTDPPWYIDLESNSAGPLWTSVDAGLLPILFDAPSVPLESAQALANELSLS